MLLASGNDNSTVLLLAIAGMKKAADRKLAPKVGKVLRKDRAAPTVETTRAETTVLPDEPTATDHRILVATTVLLDDHMAIDQLTLATDLSVDPMGIDRRAVADTVAAAEADRAVAAVDIAAAAVVADTAVAVEADLVAVAEAIAAVAAETDPLDDRETNGRNHFKKKEKQWQQRISCLMKQRDERWSAASTKSPMQ